MKTGNATTQTPEETCNTIYHMLKAVAEHTPTATAIVAPGRSPLTYAFLLEQVEHLAQSLNGMGVGRNDRVVIVLPNGPEIATALLAAAACSTTAPLNPTFRAAEFEFLFSDLQPKALIVQSGTDSPAIRVAQKHCVPIIELLSGAGREAGVGSLKGERQACGSQVGFAEAGDVALILHTSGTTSRPKMVSLTQANIIASARNIAATLELTEEDRCLNVMPLFHVHGLVGALFSSLAAGSSVICSAGFDSERFFPWLEEFRPTWYTAVPTIHQAVLSRALSYSETLRRCRLRFIRSSSAPLPLRVMQQLEKVFQAPVIESYGMTEASHQIASNPLPPGARKARSVGISAGAEVAVMNEKGDLLPHGSVGEVVIRGGAITSGYANDAAASQESFKRGWFKTGDQGYLDTDQYLFLTGRVDETINRGGEKISPAELDGVLKEHPAVSEAVTFPVSHPTLGQEIAAAIVLHGEASATTAEIQQFAASRLADFKIPRQVLIVDAIPKTATGKIQRNGLAEQLGLGSAGKNPSNAQANFADPRTPIEQTLVTIWSLVLGVNVGIDDNFFHLGGDSIHATQVISRIRASMGTDLSFLSFFDSPTVAGMARKIDSAAKRTQCSEADPLPSVHRDKALPLSFAQQRLWFLAQLDPFNPAYNRPVALHLTGELEAQVLERCLNEIVRHHEVLRANFFADRGAPMQIISPHRNLDLTVVDLSSLPESGREAEALRQAVKESQQPFDLTRGALFRPRLYRLGDQEHLLLIVTHHIVFDGWSENVLLNEIAVLYRAFLNAEVSSLPDLAFQYADYTLWQERRFEAGAWGKDLTYWRQQLNKPFPRLNLPTDRPRPAVQTYRGARQTFSLPASLTERLKELSLREQGTLFMTLLAAFKTLLSRYTGQQDILVGVPTAGRNQIETESLIGVFINTLVLRTNLSGDPSFRELFGRIRRVALEAYSHQDLPFEKLIQVSRPERDASRHPLFDVMFQFRNLPTRPVTMAGLKINSVDLDIGVAKFDLTLEVIDRPHALECRFEYNTDLFNPDTIVRMAGHYQMLLEGVVANPEQRLSDLPILTGREQHQLVVEWNDTVRNYPKDKCLHELFEAQIEKSPDAVAVVFEDEQLTYRELNQRANQLARYLRKLGVGAETLVGLCVERSVEMIVGLLGILKAGGAYVPLDPNYPKERLGFMLGDTQAPVLLTQARLIKDRGSKMENRDSLSSILNPRIKVVCLDRDWGKLAHESEKNLGNGATANNLAYVIYTSGSTGRPKAVMIPHGAICNHMFWMQMEFPLTETDRVVQKTAYSFDVSVAELFAPLLAGARLVVAQPGKQQDNSYLVSLMARQKVTVLHAVPSLLRLLLEKKEIETCICLKHVFCGGEVLPLELQERFFDRLAANLYNLCGPTETCVESTFWTCRRDHDQYTVPIGRPIANTQVYLLDRRQQPVPIGVTGELYIGGAGLARGYLNCPEMTAEKFLPDPFTTAPGARLYRTGDLARYLPDGSIEFLGRIDHQVKIRGFRIELGEIESVLRQHPAVRDTVVTALEDTPENPSAGLITGERLAAYVVRSKDQFLTINALRTFLKMKLPEYMIPTVFVFLDSLPLTPNGKINRRALQPPDQRRPELETSFTAPRTPLEERLVQIWREVLGLDKVGIHDNFFDLGGHSLLATQVISHVRTAFQIEMALATLFEKPTIAELANAILAQQAATLDGNDLAGILERIEKSSEAEVERDIAESSN